MTESLDAQDRSPSSGAAHLDALLHVAQPDHPDAVAEARAAVGRAIRNLGHAVVGHHASKDLIDRTACELESLAAAFNEGSVRSRADASQTGEWAARPADGERMTTYDERPVSGRSSPYGLDADIRRDGEEVVAHLTLRAAHEGAPGRSHGGIVAALFDDIFGFILALHALPAFTGELSVRYERATPIGVPLECRVRLAAAEGRKLFMTGELTAAGDRTVIARSKATFITIAATRGYGSE